MAESLRYDDRVAIVTGAGGGLGRAYARLLAARGAAVVVNDVDRPSEDGRTPAESTCEEIVELGGAATPCNASIAEPGAGADAVQTALDTYGRVDIIVNNAGIVRDRSFARMPEEDLRAVLDVHLLGSFRLTQAAWPHLAERRYGRVVMTTSVAGLFGNFGQANYSSAKAGLAGLGRTLAIEGARKDIRVNIVSPGAATDMTSAALPQDLHAAMSPDRVAQLVGYLCHESCTATGEIFYAAAGHYARNLIVQTAGYRNPAATVEDIAANLGQIMDTEQWTIPSDALALPET
ncbi:SDR family NAD(P)-dependent oxidoreductase [Actinomadura rugatobispora]|uniref:SDR family NAD(P)-dependent oxidoreductase n=1 Tax=Actinomadura rugatobispora TaxID=1994 RepID=A0ABW0ZV60_9ACTN|nr:SDR family NAD(P)-dependent oxidoreductase [Actinomadura rugatobispora]